MKRPWILIGACGAGLLLAPFVVPIFVPWSGINCEKQDINIKTGQARYSRSLWFVTISERVEDTALSRALNGSTVDVAEIKAWHRVNTFSPGVHHSPHHRFHGALSQADEFEVLQRVYQLDPTDTGALARQVLTEWQTNGSYYAAGRFLQDKMMELEQQGVGKN